jgi:hypothetical protein
MNPVKKKYFEEIYCFQILNYFCPENGVTPMYYSEIFVLTSMVSAPSTKSSTIWVLDTGLYLFCINFHEIHRITKL